MNKTKIRSFDDARLKNLKLASYQGNVVKGIKPPLISSTSWVVVKFQIFTKLSRADDNKCFPSGENAIHFVVMPCPLNGSLYRFDSHSHTPTFPLLKEYAI